MVTIGIITLVLYILLFIFVVGGVIWMFVEQDLQCKRYIEWMEELEKINKRK